MEEEEVEVPVVKEPTKEANKMDTDEASSNPALTTTTESDVNMQNATGATDVPGTENGALESGEKPVQMETDVKVSSKLDHN